MHDGDINTCIPNRLGSRQQMNQGSSDSLPTGHTAIQATIQTTSTHSTWTYSCPLTNTVSSVIQEIVAKYPVADAAGFGLFALATDSEPACWLTPSSPLETYKTVPRDRPGKRERTNEWSQLIFD